MPALTWGRASATIRVSPCLIIGANRSSVRANSISTKRWRCSDSQCSVDRIPLSMRRAGSCSPAMASRWAWRMEWSASVRISLSSWSLESKYQ